MKEKGVAGEENERRNETIRKEEKIEKGRNPKKQAMKNNNRNGNKSNEKE